MDLTQCSANLSVMDSGTYLGSFPVWVYLLLVPLWPPRRHWTDPHSSAWWCMTELVAARPHTPHTFEFVNSLSKSNTDRHMPSATFLPATTTLHCLQNWQRAVFLCSMCTVWPLFKRLPPPAVSSCAPAVHPTVQATHGTLGSTERSPNQLIPRFCGLVHSGRLLTIWLPKPVSRLPFISPINIPPTSGQLWFKKSWRGALSLSLDN